MKARTEREKEVVALSAQLPPLSPEQIEEARRCYGTFYVGKKSGWCSVCGHEIPSGDSWSNKRRKVAVCPHCGARLEIKRSPNKEKSDDVYYYALVRTMKGWQVLRSFICYRTTTRREMLAGVEVAPSSTSFKVVEVAQVWIDEEGRPLFMGRSCHPLGYYYDNWNLATPIVLKHEHRRYIPCGDVGKGTRLIDSIKRHGLTRLRKDVNVYDQIMSVLWQPRFETLAKAGQWKLFAWGSGSYRQGDIRDFWSSIKVAIRHGYKVTDASIWIDHLKLLQANGKDIHNPEYICPDNLKKAHRWIMKVDERRQEKIRKAEEAREELLMAERLDESSEQNQSYQKKFKKVLGVVVKSGRITLKPLQSVRDFYMEGRDLHHCVFKLKYYEHENCLILGATVNGKRTETIEVNTEDWKIVQCRGKYNQDSKYHKQIYQLATESLNSFRRCM